MRFGMKMIDVVCAVIRNENGEFFIAKRKSAVANGIWEFPGGKVEENETREAACIRECKEELDVDIVIDDFIMDYYDDAFATRLHIFAFIAHIEKGTIKYHAHQKGVWVTGNALYEYQFQTADRILLDRLQMFDQTDHEKYS